MIQRDKSSKIVKDLHGYLMSINNYAVLKAADSPEMCAPWN